jgi:hypothetical protein
MFREKGKHDPAPLSCQFHEKDLKESNMAENSHNTLHTSGLP